MTRIVTRSQPMLADYDRQTPSGPFTADATAAEGSPTSIMDSSYPFNSATMILGPIRASSMVGSEGGAEQQRGVWGWTRGRAAPDARPPSVPAAWPITRPAAQPLAEPASTASSSSLPAWPQVPAAAWWHGEGRAAEGAEAEAAGAVARAEVGTGVVRLEHDTVAWARAQAWASHVSPWLVIDYEARLPPSAEVLVVKMMESSVYDVVGGDTSWVSRPPCVEEALLPRVSPEQARSSASASTTTGARGFGARAGGSTSRPAASSSLGSISPVRLGRSGVPWQPPVPAGSRSLPATARICAQPVLRPANVPSRPDDSMAAGGIVPEHGPVPEDGAARPQGRATSHAFLDEESAHVLPQGHSVLATRRSQADTQGSLSTRRRHRTNKPRARQPSQGGVLDGL